jgi:hypothetical protein
MLPQLLCQIVSQDVVTQGLFVGYLSCPYHYVTPLPNYKDQQSPAENLTTPSRTNRLVLPARSWKICFTNSSFFVCDSPTCMYVLYSGIGFFNLTKKCSRNSFNQIHTLKNSLNKLKKI